MRLKKVVLTQDVNNVYDTLRYITETLKRDGNNTRVRDAMVVELESILKNDFAVDGND